MNRYIEKTIVHLSFLARHFSAQDVRSVTVVLLLELGIPTNFDGFDYLERAVQLFSDDPTQDMVCIYEDVAKQYAGRVDGTQIENAIRSAIKVAWEHRDADVWKHYYLGANVRGNRPTNTDFISMLARILTLWKGCCRKIQGIHEEVVI